MLTGQLFDGQALLRADDSIIVAVFDTSRLHIHDPFARKLRPDGDGYFEIMLFGQFFQKGEAGFHIVGPDRVRIGLLLLGSFSEPKQIELKTEHRDLDDVIARMGKQVPFDQLLMQRLKKRKLQLKDTISRLQAQLVPDIIA